MKSKRKNWIRITFLILITALALAICWPGGTHINIPKPKVRFEKSFPLVKLSTDGKIVNINREIKIKEGLDLQGGSHLVYIADLSNVPDKDKTDAMNSLQKVIENRVNAFGIGEPVVYTSKNGNEFRITVELPGVKNTEEAMNLIGKTAQLEFKELDSSGQQFQSTGLNGKDFKKASVAFEPNTNKPYIAIEFNSEGAKKFSDITGRNIGKPVGIYLDDKLISYPNVNQQITGGSAQITGQFTFEEAKSLSIQLNAGALPVPIKLAEQRTVEASLGAISIKQSLFAGIVGIFVVSLFMIIYYRILGIFSTIGLGLYLLYSIAIFKVFGITLTMGGIAGLILSIGMSMETDVLIFERIREEMRHGKKFEFAQRLGFDRAWTSIRDSNAVSLIICALLYFGNGMVKGFAIVLAIGIIVGLVTTFLGTRALIELIADTKWANKYDFLFNIGSDKKKQKELKNESN